MVADFRRKIYQRLQDWKKNSLGNTAALIKGARRVGKTTIVKKFAKDEYEDHLYIDFSNLKPLTRKLFEDGLQGDVKGFLTKLQLSENKMLQGKRVVVFDEVQKCPKAREMIKHLIADKSFDYIETGSLISIKKNTRNIMIPSEEYPIPMYPMDFEEFLWAKGDEISTPYLRKCFQNNEPLDDVWHMKFIEMSENIWWWGACPRWFPPISRMATSKQRNCRKGPSSNSTTKISVRSPSVNP